MPAGTKPMSSRCMDRPTALHDRTGAPLHVALLENHCRHKYLNGATAMLTEIPAPDPLWNNGDSSRVGRIGASTARLKGVYLHEDRSTLTIGESDLAHSMTPARLREMHRACLEGLEQRRRPR